MKTKPRTLAPQQRAYLEAQARWLVLNEQLRAVMSAYPEPEQDGPELDAWIDIECDASEKLGVHKAFVAMLEAEKTLLAWGHEVIKNYPLYRRDSALIEEMFSKLAYHPVFKRRAVDLIIRLDASTIPA